MAAESLNVTSEEGRGTTVPLNGELVLGRSTAGLEALRTDTEMSRVHARIWRDGGGQLMIEDLGSRNGTFLNGTRIQGARLLHAGDWLRTGKTTLELIDDDGATDGAPRYDALVEEDGAGKTVVAGSGSPGHFLPWPIASVLVALLAGGGIGAAVAASQRDTGKTTTRVVTREVERPAAPPRLSAPARAAQLPPPLTLASAQSTVNPQAGYPVAARDAFVRAFCGHGATAPRGVCGCTYVELTRREPYTLLLAQVARSYDGRIAPAIARAARACGASA